MIICRSNSELHAALASLGAVADKTATSDKTHVGFVPTMGSLHAGHLSLISQAVSNSQVTVASIFVNPTQFGPGEDFESYPRDQHRDLDLLSGTGVDIAFLPSVDDIYPTECSTPVLADRSLSSCLCGKTRPGSHFDGVATVVDRLFQIVQPSSAWFGEKDWQQVQVIREMASSLHPGVKIESGPTVRDHDGLAMSSRNAYLTATERFQARSVPRAMQTVIELTPTLGIDRALEAGRAVLSDAGLDCEYLEVRAAETLVSCSDSATSQSRDGLRLFIAARVGDVRLIDNTSLSSTHLTQATRPADSSAAALAA
ncbi:MAG: pantoate--beta-alanine ligase [Solirubrobacterales bacterium]|nr:pantoate--beta-alanine ligase [Solirubrobacterales bacterium]